MIPVCRPNLNEKDVEAVNEAVRSGFVAGGQGVTNFEQKIANYLQRQYGIGVTSGTSALEIAVAALNLPLGSKILLPSFTIISVLYAILKNNHFPYFIDVDKDTWNVSYSAVSKAINKGIDAAILVETYASGPPMIELCNLLKENKIPIIEDSAEGFGGKESGQSFGSFGDMSVLSFYANKLITTGEGGMILTDDSELYDNLKNHRNLFFDKERKFIHENISGNHRLSNLQAVLGLSQFENIDSFYRHRKMLYEIYLDIFSDIHHLIQTQLIPESIQSSYWVFPILILGKEEHLAENTIILLAENGVESRHFFYPLDRQPFLTSAHSANSSTSFNLWENGIYLPLGNGISESEVRKSAATLKKILLKIS